MAREEPQQLLEEDVSRPNVQIMARFRQVISHVVHVFGMMQLLVTLVLMFAIKAYYFFAMLALDWVVNKFLCARTAWLAGKFEERFKKRLGICRLLAVAVVYGLAEWLQVEHIQDCYNSRLQRADGQRAYDRQQGLFHGKTLDSMTVSFPFALVTLFAFFLIGPNSPEHCPWYNNVPTRFLLPAQLLLVGSFTQSCASIALGALEVDYRVNEWVANEIERSPGQACAHLVRRGSEACFNITRLILLCVFLQPDVEIEMMRVRVGAFLVCVPALVEWLLNACILSFATRGTRSVRRSRNILCVAFVALTVNPFAYFAESIYKEEARKVSRLLLALKLSMVALVTCVISLFYAKRLKFPPECEFKETIWSNFVHHQQSLLYWSIASFFLYLITLFCVRCRGNGQRDEQDGGRRLPHYRSSYYIPLLDASDWTRAPCMSLELKFAAALAGDLSSFVLALGGVLANSMVPSRRDFAILKKLGEGTNGVAVKAKLLSTGDDYCLKLVFTKNYERELRMLQKVTNVTHVFIVKLFRAFEVDPQGPPLKQTDGRVIQQARTGRHDFRFAMMITYVDGGNLEEYIKEGTWTMENISRTNKMRTFAAEIAEILRFLHECGIVYRDLKPDNVLVKLPSGRQKQSHICLTDLGWAKRPEEDGSCVTCAGNAGTAAHEVVDGRMDERGVLPPDLRTGVAYDKSVDVFSWAANYLQMQGLPVEESKLLRSSYYDPERAMSQPQFDVPVKVRPLLMRCLGRSNRPTMEEVLKDEFFTDSCDHNGEIYHSINMADLMADAASDAPAHEIRFSRSVEPKPV